jgi:hypothetical protein
MGRQDKDPLEVLGSALLPRKYRKLSAIAKAVKALATKDRAEPQPSPAGSPAAGPAPTLGAAPFPAAAEPPRDSG